VPRGRDARHLRFNPCAVRADEMSVNIGAVSGGSVPSYLTTPAVQLAQLQDASLSALFGGATGDPADLTALTSAVVALPLYQQPGLLTNLGGWGGSLLAGSLRAATDPAPAPASASSDANATAAPAASPFTFNPFDQSSWWTDPLGSTVDTSA
jgi:hypothetical protein